MAIEKLIMDILRESAAQYFRPLFRGTIPLMGHSFASASLGLVGQPKLKKWVQVQLGSSGDLPAPATSLCALRRSCGPLTHCCCAGMSNIAVGLVASAVVSPIYVGMTNPIARLGA